MVRLMTLSRDLCAKWQFLFPGSRGCFARCYFFRWFFFSLHVFVFPCFLFWFCFCFSFFWSEFVNSERSGYSDRSERLSCRWIRIERSPDIFVNAFFPYYSRTFPRSPDVPTGSRAIKSDFSRYARTSQTRRREFLAVAFFNLGKKDANTPRGF